MENEYVLLIDDTHDYGKESLLDKLSKSEYERIMEIATKAIEAHTKE